MPEESFQRARAIFLEAVRRQPEAGRMYVREACRGDEALEALVLRLLDADVADDVEASEGAPAHRDEQPPEIPGLTMQHRIASGGMGSVHLARQHNPERQVAVKVIRAGHVTPTALKRFEYETSVLGMLQHPGIAQIFDAGIIETPHGARPYFIMEYIDGRPLDQFLDDRAASTRERLKTIAELCDAVECAHRKGVIHRDLKPANILVTAEGRVKVLDFGVARAVESDLRITTVTRNVGRIIGTLPYMSPEQATGRTDMLDTRSDVYALGVILFEMLTGELPYRLSGRMIPDAVRVIAEEPPTKLSRRSRALRGDVETIVGKALAKEPERRYASAGALAADIRRFLHDKPIEARPPSITYHLSKFTRRNKGAVAALTLLMLVAVTAAAIIVDKQITQIRTAQQRDQAAIFWVERIRNIDLDAMSRSIREAVPKESVDAPTLARDLLRDHVLLPLIHAAEEDLEDQPLVCAQIIFEVAETMRQLGLVEVTDAFNTRRDARPENAQATAPLDEAAWRLSLARSALEVHQHALDIRRRNLDDDDPDILRSLHVIGVLERQLGRYDDAERNLQAALDGRRRTLGPEHRETVESMSEFGRLLRFVERIEEAGVVWKKALDIAERRWGPDDPLTLECMGNVGLYYESTRQFEEAERRAREYLERIRRLRGEDHPDAIASLHGLSAILRVQGRSAEAEPYARELVRRHMERLGAEHPHTLSSLNELALVCQGVGRTDEAMDILRRVVEGRSRVLGAEHPKTRVSQNNLAVAYSRAGRHADAVVILEQLFEIEVRQNGHPQPLLVNNLADAMRKAGQNDRAGVLLTDGLPNARAKWTDANPFYLGVYLTNLGLAETERDRFDHAEAALLEAHELLVNEFDARHSRTQKCAQALVDLYTRWAAADDDPRLPAAATRWQDELASD